MIEVLKWVPQAVVILPMVYHMFMGYSSYIHKDIRSEIHHYAWAIMFVVAGVVL